MSHASRPLHIGRAFAQAQVAPRLFSYSDAEIDRRDQEQEDRSNTPHERYCSYCTGGHNCPECSGWDDEEQESE